MLFIYLLNRNVNNLDLFTSDIETVQHYEVE